MSLNPGQAARSCGKVGSFENAHLPWTWPPEKARMELAP
jgi:hypothetical protein